MSKGNRLSLPTLLISLLALFAALGGSVYAATKINGKSIRVKSLPGNRLKLHSIAANRLKRGVLRGTTGSGLLTGADINELTLDQVPEAAHSESSDTAASANESQTAVNAVNAINAETVNGHHAGCIPDTVLFAGACWQSTARGPATAPESAARCAAEGGTLPEALQLAAFAEVPGIKLEEEEWSSDIPIVSGPGVFAVVTVSDSPEISSDTATKTHKYRCVIPLVV
jgi:hypothetical protein